MSYYLKELPCWLSGKEPACKAGNTGLIPGSGRSPVEGNGNPLQYSCLGNPMDREAWWATVPNIWNAILETSKFEAAKFSIE